MIVALWALLPLWAGPQEAGPVTAEAVTREIRIRAWALDLEATREVLLWELAAEPWNAWPRRFAAVDALVRGMEVHLGPIEPWMADAVAVGLADAHPNVRARALAGAWAMESLPGDLLGTLAADPSPQVREALALDLSRRHGEERDAVLRDLWQDPDARVADAARDALVGARSLPDSRQLVFRMLADARDGEGLLHCFEILQRDVPDPVLFQVLRRIWRDRRRSEFDGEWRAVLEAIDPQEPEVLVSGWFDGELERGRQELLIRVGEHGNVEVGRSLLEVLLWFWPPDHEPGQDELASAETPEEQATAVTRFHLAHDLFDAAYLSLGGAGLRRELATLDEFAPPAGLAFVLEEAGLRVQGWGEEGQRWIDPSRHEGVRLAAVGAYAQTLARTGDAGSRNLLIAAVDDPAPKVRAVAWNALREAGVFEPLVAPMLAQGDDAFLEDLERFPQGPLPDPFRDRLLAIGAERGTERGTGASTVVERLASWPGDAEVRAVVEEWLRGQLAALLATPPEADEFRAVELAAMGCLRTLAALDVEGSIPVLVEALRASHGRSTDVGKTAARALAAPGEPVARLGAFLGADVDRRTRIEAAIGVARHGAERDDAVRVLITDLPQAAWNLRVRMIEALGRANTEEARAFLRTLPFDPAREPEDRMRALEALARIEGERALLLRAARGAPDPDSRFVAATLLGQDPDAGDDLRALASELADPERDDGVLRGEERRELRLQVLIALAARGQEDAEHRHAILAPLLAAAPATLDDRFRGVPVAKPGFLWRGELEFLAALAQRGELAEALASAGPWWSLGAPVLFELARRAPAEGPDTALALQRGALIASAGEPEASRHVNERGRAVLLGLAWEAESWKLAARTASTLLADWRALRFPDAVWDAQFGAFDRDAGVDPRARLAAAAVQARGWAALERGEVERAAEEARLSRTRLGLSRAAEREQERLEAAIDDAR